MPLLTPTTEYIDRNGAAIIARLKNDKRRFAQLRYIGAEHYDKHNDNTTSWAIPPTALNAAALLTLFPRLQPTAAVLKLALAHWQTEAKRAGYTLPAIGYALSPGDLHPLPKPEAELRALYGNTAIDWVQDHPDAEWGRT